MITIGLTGSIAMGKSETAKMFKHLGISVFDADAAVHALYARGGAAVGPIAAAFPGAVRDGAVDRKLLAEALGDDAKNFARLEAIVHPLVRAEADKFLSDQRAGGAELAVLDIPLLFETGRDKEFDVVVVVSAPPEVQRQRVLARPGMTEEAFARILARQMPDAEKRRRADFVVDSSKGLKEALEQVRSIVETVGEQAKHA